MLSEYDQVKVTKLEENDREYDGTDNVKHAPAIGDTGIIVFITTDENTGKNVYTVENVDANGYTVWLAEFSENEITPYVGETSNYNNDPLLTGKTETKKKKPEKPVKKAGTYKKPAPQKEPVSQIQGTPRVNVAQDNEFSGPKEPGLIVYLSGAAIAGIASTAMSSYWLEITPVWLAVLLGVLFGLVGIFMLANISEAIVFSVIIALIVFFLFKSPFELIYVKMVITPLFTGYCVGQIIVGIWKELPEG